MLFWWQAEVLNSIWVTINLIIRSLKQWCFGPLPSSFLQKSKWPNVLSLAITTHQGCLWKYLTASKVEENMLVGPFKQRKVVGSWKDVDFQCIKLKVKQIT